MEFFWAFLFLLMMIIVLFVVFPAFIEEPRREVVVPVKVPPPRPDHMLKQSLEKNAIIDKQMLDSHYKNAGPVYIEYPRKPIGDCPYSKPPSTDLPMADVPQCMAASSSFDMYLRASKPTTA